MVIRLNQGVQAFTSNTFLVPGDRPVVVDAGANFDVVPRIREHTDTVEAVILTHTHSDHIGNLPAIREAFDVDVWGYDPAHDAVDYEIPDKANVTIGDHPYQALHTPGHKNDHLCLYSRDARTVFSGDLVFQNGSFGRTDLEEGDRGLLIESIQRLLDTIDPDLEALHSGHGPSVTTDPYQHIELARRYADTLL